MSFMKKHLLMMLFTIASFGFISNTLAQKQTGIASYYADKFTGKRTASGQVFSNKKYTAAHKTLKFGTKVKVTNLANNKSVIVTINDRGPHTRNREIDLSKRPFLDISHNHGRSPLRVSLEIVE